jgi:hypothetical protein
VNSGDEDDVELLGDDLEDTRGWRVAVDRTGLAFDFEALLGLAEAGKTLSPGAGPMLGALLIEPRFVGRLLSL